MKIIFISICILFYFVSNTKAQISGADSVCSGYIYTYNVNIPGADSVSWTFPYGWHQLNSSSMQVEVLCNGNIGQICATGFDSLGINIGQQCKQVHWGGAGGGWHVQTQQVLPSCQCPNYTVSVIPDGPLTCGTCNGIPSPYLVFAVYSSPANQFMVFANGIDQLALPFATTSYFVYLIDTTFGLTNAIRIVGGLCTSTIINSFQLNPCTPIVPGINATPNPVCVGDTLTLQYDHLWGLFNAYNWQAGQGHVTFIPPLNLDHIRCIINSAAFVSITLICWNNNCAYYGSIIPNYIDCTIPLASFQSGSSGICENTCANFHSTSSHATSYHWQFPGGTPSSDTTSDPQGICYFNSGIFDVTLIVGNTIGSDTLTIPNAVTVYPQIPFTPITQSGDTLYSAPGYVSYQWYFNSTLLTGANDYYFVVPQNGDYSVVVSDSNGCNATSYVLNVVASTNDNNQLSSGFKVNYADGVIYLEINSTSMESCFMQMTDEIGREVFRKSILLKNGMNEINLEGKVILNGIYFIKVQCSKQVTMFNLYIH